MNAGPQPPVPVRGSPRLYAVDGPCGTGEVTGTDEHVAPADAGPREQVSVAEGGRLPFQLHGGGITGLGIRDVLLLQHEQGGRQLLRAGHAAVQRIHPQPVHRCHIGLRRPWLSDSGGTVRRRTGSGRPRHRSYSCPVSGLR
nr:hypothetical protein GCM10020092_077660 [Actinoplanes digitatis]